MINIEVAVSKLTNIRSARSALIPKNSVGTIPDSDNKNTSSPVPVMIGIHRFSRYWQKTAARIIGAKSAVPAKPVRASKTICSLLTSDTTSDVIAKATIAPRTTVIGLTFLNRTPARISLPSANNCESAVEIAAAISPTITIAPTKSDWSLTRT